MTSRTLHADADANCHRHRHGHRDHYADRHPDADSDRFGDTFADGKPSPTLSPTPTARDADTNTHAHADSRPRGLSVQGYVRLDDASGPGLAGVTIEIFLANDPSPAAAALTDETGYYEVPFIAIPGDEMLTNRATLSRPSLPAAGIRLAPLQRPARDRTGFHRFNCADPRHRHQRCALFGCR